MAAIWNDIEIEWDGETYRLRPTLEILNRLEQKPGRSLSQMLIRLTNNDLPSGAACELIAEVINLAGGDVSAEKVFEETAGIGQDVQSLAYIILSGLMPPVKGGDKPSGGKKKSEAVSEQTGEKSTE